jgi:hypothetical protein
MANKSSSNSMLSKAKAKLSNAHKVTGKKPSQGFSSRDIGDMMLQIGKDEGVFKSKGGKIMKMDAQYKAAGGTIFKGR